MNNKIISYKLKVPSHVELATPTNLWKFVQILPTLPDNFKKSDIANNKDFPLNNHTAISRVTAYLKYLGILTEEREIMVSEGNAVKKQFFSLTEKGQRLKKTALADSENLIKAWKEIIKESELYLALTETDDFQKYNRISMTTLRKLLVDSFSKNVVKLQKRLSQAEKYIIRFLEENELFTLNDEYLIPFGSSVQILEKSNIDFSENGFYHVKTDDYELKVRYDDSVFDMLQMQIEIIKKKFKSIQKSKKDEERDE